MAYIKPREQPFGKMQRLLLGYQLNAPALARVLNCSESTARSRVKNPGELTLTELSAINRRGHVPIEEIREAISIV